MGYSFKGEKQKKIIIQFVKEGMTKKGTLYTAIMDEDKNWWNYWGVHGLDLEIGQEYGIFYHGINSINSIFPLKERNHA